MPNKIFDFGPCGILVPIMDFYAGSGFFHCFDKKSRDELSSSQTTNSIAVATPSSFESVVCTDTPNGQTRIMLHVNVTSKLMLVCPIDAWFGVTRVPRSITLLAYPWVWLIIIVVFVVVVPILLYIDTTDDKDDKNEIAV